ncbi:MAG: amidohydrolase [Alphaproteobacteria bacterium CG_4_9_14_3_um_filter_47_13]|nr:MAG: amidohydrolase [Alphaproteobacteria bacterium CG_4_9_14_3_um_filter_47_13]
MPVINSIADRKDEIAAWRQELHRNAQTKYEEVYAGDLIAKKLEEWGIPHTRGFAKTGIVATIEGQKTDSGKAIALRADMDALDIQERTGLPYASCNEGKMHACGHDGHMASLLGATKYLNETKNFNGKVHLIFQPAEEGGSGADKMIEEGLFKKFPCNYVFGFHNWPTLPVGTINMRVGGIMASVDEFEIIVKGKGGHAAMPENTIDPIVIASQIVIALQTIVSRTVSPIDTAVVSVTNMNAGTGAFNVIPGSARLHGTVRTFSNDVRHKIKERMESIVGNISKAFDSTIEIDYIFQTEPTVNTADGIAIAAKAAALVVGEKNVDTNCLPTMGGEDFGAFLIEKPGAFVFIGQGVANDPHCHSSMGLHHPNYDFNDEILPIGSSYFAALAETYMPLET